MNHHVISCECDAGMCSACRFEDCACECHDPEDESFYDAGEDDTMVDGYA